MTREEFWMHVYMASFNDQHYGDQAISEANAALAAYDEALKKYGEAEKIQSLTELENEQRRDLLKEAREEFMEESAMLHKLSAAAEKVVNELWAGSARPASHRVLAEIVQQVKDRLYVEAKP